MSMNNQQSLSLNLNQFRSYLVNLIETQTSINITLSTENTDTLYRFYLGLSNKQLNLSQVLNEFGLQQDQIQLIGSLMQNQSLKLQSILQKFTQYIEQDIEQFDNVELMNDKFQLFLNHKLVDDKTFQEKLRQQHDLDFEGQQLIQKLNQLNNLALSQQNFNKAVKQLLISSQTYFDNFDEGVQNDILHTIVTRKQKYHESLSIIKLYGISHPEQALKSIYDQGYIQPFKKFEERAKQILLKQFPKLSKFKKALLEDCLKQLYSLNFKKSFRKVKDILIKFRILKGNERISQSLIKQIYTIEGEYIQQILDEQKPINKQVDSRQAGELSSMTSVFVDLFKSQSFNQPLKPAPQKQVKQQKPLKIKKIQTLPPNYQQSSNNPLLMLSQQFLPSQEEVQQQQIPNTMKRIKSLADEPFRIQSIIRQIQNIKTATKNTQCFQLVLRELELSILKDKTATIGQLIVKLKSMLEKYQIKNPDIEQNIEKIQNTSYKKRQRISKLTTIRRAIEGINLEEIIQTKKEIDLNKDCEGASAIMIVGYTGAGKSTMMVGLSGYTLERNAETGDFQCTDQTIRDKYKISNSTMSVTRWANVSKVKEGWSGKTKVLLIDTPGLDDNRGVEIDITNNLGTVKLLKTLGRGRIVIAISLNDFGNRWFNGFRRLINNVAQYFTDIETLQRSMTFVLTKGLSIQRLNEQFKAFLSCEGFTTLNWSENQNNLIELMRDKFSSIPRQHQIQDPSSHDFFNLAKSLLSLGQTDQPGDYIQASFSRDSKNTIENTLYYLKQMIVSTFEKRQFVLVKFYLQNLGQLQQIYQQKHQYFSYIQKLKAMLKDKLQKFETFGYEYLQNGSERALKQMKEFYDHISDKQAVSLYEILYKNVSFSNIMLKLFNFSNIDEEVTPSERQNKFPNQLADEFIRIEVVAWLQDQIRSVSFHTLISQTIQNISTDSFIKKRIVFCLNISKIFCSQEMHNKIMKKINAQIAQLEKKISQILLQPALNHQTWAKYVQIYKNQIETDIKIIDCQSNNQRIQKLYKIIQSYFKFNPKQKRQIRKTLIQNRSNKMNGDLQKVSVQYIQKLQILGGTDIVLKSLIDPEMDQLIEMFTQQIRYYEKQQERCIKTFDNITMQSFEICQSNKQEIFKIYLSLKPSSFDKYKFQGQSQTLFSYIDKKIKQSLKTFERNVDDLLRNQSTTKYQTVGDNIHEVLQILNFVKKLKKQNEQKMDSHTLQNVQARYLKEIVDKSQNILHGVGKKIEQVQSRSQVSNFEPNHKLTACMFILTLLQPYSYEHENESKKALTSNLLKTIKDKLLRPFETTEQLKFSSWEDYQKLYKILSYLKNLDQKILQCEIKIDGFDHVFPLGQCELIKKAVKKSLMKISGVYEQFGGFMSIIRDCNSNLHSMTKSKLDRTHSEISLNIVEYLTPQINKSIINYILSFQNIKKISDQFKDQLVILTSHFSQFENCDIVQGIFNRSKWIQDRVEDQKNPMKGKFLSLDELFLLFKEVRFYSKIYNSIQSLNEFKEQLNIEHTLSQLKSSIQNYQNKFDQLYRTASQTYKNLKSSVEFDDLKKLLQHPYRNDKNNQNRINELLASMESQYQKIIRSFYPELGKNTDILLNIAQFLQIVKESEFYNVTQSFNNEIFRKNCNIFFQQLQNKLQELTNISESQEEKNIKNLELMLIEEQKILNLLQTEYQDFKQKSYSNQNQYENIGPKHEPKQINSHNSQKLYEKATQNVQLCQNLNSFGQSKQPCNTEQQLYKGDKLIESIMDNLKQIESHFC